MSAAANIVFTLCGSGKLYLEFLQPTNSEIKPTDKQRQVTTSWNLLRALMDGIGRAISSN